VAAEEDVAIGVIHRSGRLTIKSCGGRVRDTGTLPRMVTAPGNACFSEKAPRRQPGMF
jgi:hypothetical protein